MCPPRVEFSIHAFAMFMASLPVGKLTASPLKDPEVYTSMPNDDCTARTADNRSSGQDSLSLPTSCN